MKQKKILIIEDDADIREALKEVLEIEGLEAVLACNGQEGLAQLRSEQKIDVIILDIMMPVMNGLAFLEAVKKEREWAKIPVIALSAAMNKSADLGVAAFIRKPLDITLLLTTIQKLSASDPSLSE